MKKNKLSQEEIKSILIESCKPKYSDPKYLHLGQSRTSIFKVSKKGLILVYGTEKFGYKHITQKHLNISRKPYWKGQTLNNPTKFSSNIAPIDIIHIADEIFLPENLNTEENYDPGVFDLYIGNDKDGIKYRLFTYKGTGIIQSFFVCNDNKPFNKPKILDYADGFFDTTISNGIQMHKKSYYDRQKIKRYIVIVRIIPHQRCEKWYVQVNNKDGSPLLTTLIRENLITEYIEGPFCSSYLDFKHLSDIEIEIQKMDSGKYSF